MSEEEMRLIENFLLKEKPEELSFKEKQAIVHMLYSIYIYTVLVRRLESDVRLNEWRKKKGGTKDARRHLKRNP